MMKIIPIIPTIPTKIRVSIGLDRAELADLFFSRLFLSEIAREPFCSTTVVLYSIRGILHLATDALSGDIREEMAETPRNIGRSGDRPLTERSWLALSASKSAQNG